MQRRSHHLICQDSIPSVTGRQASASTAGTDTSSSRSAFSDMIAKAAGQPARSTTRCGQSPRPAPARQAATASRPGNRIATLTSPGCGCQIARDHLADIRGVDARLKAIGAHIAALVQSNQGQRGFRDRASPDALARGHGASRATAYRYPDEVITALAALTDGMAIAATANPRQGREPGPVTPRGITPPSRSNRA